MIVVDFDGTTIRGDLSTDFSRWLARRTRDRRWKDFLCLPIGAANLASRGVLELHVANRQLMFSSSDELNIAADEFIEEFADRYEVNWGLVDSLLACQDWRLLLSGGLEFLITKFLIARDINVFDEVIGQRSGRLGWVLNPCPFGRAKSRFVREPIDLAIGNDYSDRHILRQAVRGVLIREERHHRESWANEFEQSVFGESIELRIV